MREYIKKVKGNTHNRGGVKMVEMVSLRRSTNRPVDSKGMIMSRNTISTKHKDTHPAHQMTVLLVIEFFKANSFIPLLLDIPQGTEFLLG